MTSTSAPCRPKISVIVPLFDTREYLERCIQSISTQTFSDIEILCIDDCSPDDSAAIVERLAAQDPRVKLIRHSQNRGLGGARNTGIRSAAADYVASVDSDDYIEPQMLQALWDGTEDGKHDVVVCGYEMVDEAGHSLGKAQTTIKTLEQSNKLGNPFRVANPAFWNKLWRRSLFIDNEVFFPEEIFYQDSATSPRVFQKAKSINFVGGEHYKYVRRVGSTTSSKSDKHLLDKFRELDVMKEYFLTERTYGAHAPHMRDRIRKSFRYHANNVFRNRNGNETRTDQYLRHLLLMREAYLNFDDKVRSMTIEQKVAAFEHPGSLFMARAPKAQHEARPKNTGRNGQAEPRILVLTLYSGENEFERSCASLRAQTHRNFDHKVLRYLPNADAHRDLYETIMRKRLEYDLFLKLDADMLLANVNVLNTVMAQFAKTPDLDHLIVPCDDFMTGTSIIGVHCFSTRVRWEPNPDGLFLDPSPQRPGRRIIMSRPSPTWFLHSPDPSPLQAFHFGAHRCLKLVQRNRPAERTRTEAIRTQWTALRQVWERFLSDRDLRHGLALAAAHGVITGEIESGAHDYSDPSLRAAFSKAERLSTETLFEKLAPHWRDNDAQAAYLRRARGPDAAELDVVAEVTGVSHSDDVATQNAKARSFRPSYNEARLRLQGGEYQSALDKMQAALVLKPDSKLARMGIAEALIGLGKTGEGMRIYDALVQEHPADRALFSRYNRLLRAPKEATPQVPKHLKRMKKPEPATAA